MAITYTPTTNFGSKDSLPTNDPDKVIKGSEFTTEFTAIQTAFGLAAPAASPTFTGTVTIASVDINGGTIDGVTIGGSSAGAITGTTGQFNTSLNVDGTVTADGATLALGSVINFSDRGNLTHNASTYDMTFNTNSVANALVIKGTGNVGIGTSSPTQPLEIKTATDKITQFMSGAGSAVQWQTINDAKTANVPLAISTSETYFLTGGSERLRISSSGNVGIGVTTQNERLRIGSATAGEARLTIEYNNNVMTYFGSYSGIVGSGNADDTFLTTNGAKNLILGTNGTERLRIDSSGNLLVGTTSSTYGGQATVRAAGQTALSLQNSNFAAASAGTQLNTYFGATTGDTYVAQQVNSGGGLSFGNLVLQPNGGNVGIGTSSPNDLLSLQSSSTVDLSYNTTATGSGVSLGRSLYRWQGTDVAQIRVTTGTDTVNHDDAYMSFFTSDGTFAERMRIDSSGNLLVGTTSAAPGSSNTNVGCAFEGVTGVVYGSRASGASGVFNANADGQLVRCHRSGSLVGSISVTTTATAYNTSSDYRLKDVDGPITNSGAYIDALKPVQGSWKADGSRFIGLIAHEVQEVSETPIATGEKDGEEMQGMDYSAPELIANLIAEIQSLRARVAQLEGA
jgi:hypothetical protein